MNSKRPSFSAPKDTPATRKRRLQARLQEITEKGEQEMSALMKSLDKVRSNFKSKKDLQG